MNKKIIISIILLCFSIIPLAFAEQIPYLTTCIDKKVSFPTNNSVKKYGRFVSAGELLIGYSKTKTGNAMGTNMNVTQKKLCFPSRVFIKDLYIIDVDGQPLNILNQCPDALKSSNKKRRVAIHAVLSFSNSVVHCRLALLTQEKPTIMELLARTPMQDVYKTTAQIISAGRK